VQTGGPSGGCIPAQHFDTPVDFESLGQLGSIMGSGGMIIMDEKTCMVDVAKYFMDFCRSESCGKCIPCRVGTHHTYNILDKISRGVATMDDMALLEELCDVMKNTSLCGLGQSAPNPVLSTLRYFKDEYLAHIKEKKCPAGVCFPLTPTLSHGEMASSEKGAQ
jgi:bidirectional [NiFe] hydrogenase diaphorase subunit